MPAPPFVIAGAARRKIEELTVEYPSLPLALDLLEWSLTDEPLRGEARSVPDFFSYVQRAYGGAPGVEVLYHYDGVEVTVTDIRILH